MTCYTLVICCQGTLQGTMRRPRDRQLTPQQNRVEWKLLHLRWLYKLLFYYYTVFYIYCCMITILYILHIIYTAVWLLYYIYCCMITILYILLYDYYIIYTAVWLLYYILLLLLLCSTLLEWDAIYLETRQQSQGRPLTATSCAHTLPILPRRVPQLSHSADGTMSTLSHLCLLTATEWMTTRLMNCYAEISLWSELCSLVFLTCCCQYNKNYWLYVANCIA